MAVRARSAVIYLPALERDRFLRNVANQIEALRAECAAQGHGLLASLLAMAKDEAEDDLQTAMRSRRHAEVPEEYDAATVRMARRLAPDLESEAV